MPLPRDKKLGSIGVIRISYREGESLSPSGRERSYSDEDLLREVRRVAALAEGPSLIMRGFKKHSSIALATLTQRFGEWRRTLELAGVGHMSFFSDTPAGPRCKYTDAELLEEVLRVASLVERPVLTMTDFKNHASVSLSAVCKRFGPWRTVLGQAGAFNMYSGVPARPHRVYTDEALLEELRRVAQLVGKRVLTRGKFRELSTIGPDSMSRHFGSWREALERAGLGEMYSGVVPGHRVRPVTDFTDEKLIEELQRVAVLVGKPIISTIDFNKHATLSTDCVRRRFGSWREALQMAGIGEMYSGRVPAPRPVDHYTDAQLMQAVRKVAGVVKKAPLTRSDFQRLSGINPDTLTRRFGDWRVVLERAGVRHMYSGQVITDRKRVSRKFASDAEVLEVIRYAAAQNDGNHLTYQACRELTGLGTSTINRRFGNWRGALEAAGLSADGVPKRYTDDERFDNLAMIWQHYGRPPKRSDVERPPSVVGGHLYERRWGLWPDVLERFVEWADQRPTTYPPPMNGADRFESWTNALTAIGLPPARFVRVLTDEECFRNLADLWVHHRQRPTGKQVGESPSRMSTGAYQARWGTLSKAVEAFVLWADANGLPPPTDGVQQFGSWRSALAAYQRPSPRRHTEEECFRNLANLWRYYRGQPTSSKLRLPPSTLPIQAYLHRWGTWPKAVEAFLEWAKDASLHLDG